MRAVRLLVFETREAGVRVAAILVDDVRCRMQRDPFVETDILAVKWTREIAQILKSVGKIRQLLPKIASTDCDSVLSLVLVPDRPHPRAVGAGHQKMGRGERTAIVEYADQD